MNQKGFTLIELLTSIAIIALILAMTLVSVITLTSNAKDKSYALFEKNILDAANIYGEEYSLDLDYTINKELNLQTACFPIELIIDKGIIKRTDIVDKYIKEGHESVFLSVNETGIRSYQILKGKCEDNENINPEFTLNSDLVTSNSVSKYYGEEEDNLLKYVTITNTDGRSGRVYIYLNNGKTPYMTANYDEEGNFDKKVDGNALTKNLNNVKSNKVTYKLVPDATAKIVSATLDYKVLDSTPILELSSNSLSYIVGTNINLLDGVLYDDFISYNNRPLDLKVFINGNESAKVEGTTYDLGMSVADNTVTYTVSNVFQKFATKTRTYTIRTSTVVQYSTAKETTTYSKNCGWCYCGANGEVECVGCTPCPSTWDGTYTAYTSCGTYSAWSTNRGSGDCCRKRICSTDASGNVTNCENYTSC